MLTFFQNLLASSFAISFNASESIAANGFNCRASGSGAVAVGGRCAEIGLRVNSQKQVLTVKTLEELMRLISVTTTPKKYVI